MTLPVRAVALMLSYGMLSHQHVTKSYVKMLMFACRMNLYQLCHFTL